MESLVGGRHVGRALKASRACKKNLVFGLALSFASWSKAESCEIYERFGLFFDLAANSSLA
jgi:hypothetical protein